VHGEVLPSQSQIPEGKSSLTWLGQRSCELWSLRPETAVLTFP